MSVICLTSLKGGVGKTSLSINLAHALAKESCQVLLIDFDPAAHASRYLRMKASSPLAQLFLLDGVEKEESILDLAINSDLNLITPIRKNLDLIPGGAELRHFFWGQGARTFKNLFHKFINEMENVYDYILIDTAPDFNILTRNAIAASCVSLVPVDTSEMSIFGLEEIMTNCSHIKGPTWGIVRSMVPKQASRIQKLSENRIGEQFNITSTLDSVDPEDEEFFELIENFESKKEKAEETPSSNAPIFLFNAKIYRSEQMNRLSFSGKTAFDTKATESIAKQYSAVSHELESLIEMGEGLEPEFSLESLSKISREERASEQQSARAA